MAKRYIDADLLWKSITSNYDYGMDLTDVLEEIQHTPTADVVVRSMYDQVRWELDTAIEQLAEIGKGLGENMDDVVVRKRRRAYDKKGNCYSNIRRDGIEEAGD